MRTRFSPPQRSDDGNDRRNFSNLRTASTSSCVTSDARFAYHSWFRRWTRDHLAVEREIVEVDVHRVRDGLIVREAEVEVAPRRREIPVWSLRFGVDDDGAIDPNFPFVGRRPS